MKRFEKALEECEKSLLLLSAVLAAFFFVVLFWPGQKEGSVAKAGNLPSLPKYIEVENEAYLQAPSLENIVNPMTFRKKLPLTQALLDKKVVTKKDPPKKDPPKKEPPKQVVETKKNPPPKPPSRVIDLTYRGIYKGLQNEPMAFVLASDTASKTRDSSLVLKEGERIFELFKVLSFDEELISVEDLSLDDKDNRTFTINRNKSVKFTLRQ